MARKGEYGKPLPRVKRFSSGQSPLFWRATDGALRAREAEPKIPGPCGRGARAAVSRRSSVRRRVGRLHLLPLAIPSARASPPVRGFTGRSRRVPRPRRPVSSVSRGSAARQTKINYGRNSMFAGLSERRSRERTAAAWRGAKQPATARPRVRPTPAPRRIPHRYAASVLPARPRPLRLVARPFWAVPDGARSQGLPGRRIGAAAHTGRREDEARPEGERRSDGRGMRGGMRREREAGRAKAARKRAAGRPASRRVRARRAPSAQSEGRAAARAAPRPTDGPTPIA